MSRRGISQRGPALHYELLEPPAGCRPTHSIVLGHALGCDLRLWDGLAGRLAAQGARVLRYDQRGHGQSGSPPGPYQMAELAADAARLIDELALGPVVWIGLSLGGMVGQELALRHPGRVKALVLANTCAAYPEEARAGWSQRIAAIEQGGLEAIVDAALQRWFHAGFHASQPQTVALWRQRVLACDPAGYIACCAAIREHDTVERLPAIHQPTLVIAGALDAGTPPAMAKQIAALIPGAQLVVLAEAAHLSVLEQPVAFGDCVEQWLNGLAAS